VTAELRSITPTSDGQVVAPYRSPEHRCPRPSCVTFYSSRLVDLGCRPPRGVFSICTPAATLRLGNPGATSRGFRTSRQATVEPAAGFPGLNSHQAGTSCSGFGAAPRSIPAAWPQIEFVKREGCVLSACGSTRRVHQLCPQHHATGIGLGSGDVAATLNKKYAVDALRQFLSELGVGESD
jgi:hypothetical protein